MGSTIFSSERRNDTTELYPRGGRPSLVQTMWSITLGSAVTVGTCGPVVPKAVYQGSACTSVVANNTDRLQRTCIVKQFLVRNSQGIPPVVNPKIQAEATSWSLVTPEFRESPYLSVAIKLGSASSVREELHDLELLVTAS
ncbi:hypothetical protein J6590_009766 [Homalodisca vitripennis]|nr:hypothetical protein J6590_009766 [Homalodisca vitripennis]